MTGAELEVLAVLVFQEARNQPFIGQVAVAEVVLNRVRLPNFPKTIRRVIKQPYQFSGVGAKGVVQTKAQAMRLNPEAWSIAYTAATFARASNITNGATHFHATYVNPNWSSKRYKTKRIGSHKFYKLH